MQSQSYEDVSISRFKLFLMRQDNLMLSGRSYSTVLQPGVRRHVASVMLAEEESASDYNESFSCCSTE